jgi:hypothetical protein
LSETTVIGSETVSMISPVVSSTSSMLPRSSRRSSSPRMRYDSAIAAYRHARASLPRLVRVMVAARQYLVA